MANARRAAAFCIAVLTVLVGCEHAATPGGCPSGQAGACTTLRPVLLGLASSVGALSPAFAPENLGYEVTLGGAIDAVQLTPTAASSAASILVNGMPTESGTPSPSVPVPPGASEIRIDVSLPGGESLAYRILVNREAPVFVKPSNSGGDFGAVAIAGDLMAIGAPSEASGATGIDGDQFDVSKPSTGAVYVFRREAGVWRQEAYLKPLVTGYATLFGGAVAIHGNRLAVGAPFDNSRGRGVGSDPTDVGDYEAGQSGAVYLFVRSGGVWSLESYVKPSNTALAQWFGTSVALFANTLAVGAPMEPSSREAPVVTGAGAVFVFTREGEAWSQQAYITASDRQPSSLFGLSVSLAEDRLAVGAPWAASEAGAVYVFRRVMGRWSEEADLSLPTKNSQLFGASVSISGDLLAAGAPQEASKARGIDGDESDQSLFGAGAVYVFRRQEQGWIKEAYIKPSNTSSWQLFGQSVSLEGNLLAVGAPWERSKALGVNGDDSDTSLVNSGAAFLFVRQSGAWSQQSYVKATRESAENNEFGQSVCLDGTRLAVGAPKESSPIHGMDGVPDGGEDASGAVYLY